MQFSDTLGKEILTSKVQELYPIYSLFKICASFIKYRLDKLRFIKLVQEV